MSMSRIETAIESGAFDWPHGPVVVLGATARHDLGAFPSEQVTAVSHVLPDIAALGRAGLTASQTLPETADLAVVFLPRSKVEARGMIAEAARIAGGRVVVDGQKTDGVESILKALKARDAVGPVVSKGHGKLFVLTGDATLSDWAAPDAYEPAPGFRTVPGVFSAERIDPGSALLAEALPAKLPARMADFGAGWGYLSAAVLARQGVAALDLVEADGRALDCARGNLSDDRVRYHWADVRDFRPDTPFDGIVMNPPFHSGRAAEPDLGQAFIRAASTMLVPQGRLWMVANRHLPYEAVLRQAFQEVTEIGGTGGFKLFAAAGPGRGGKLAPGAVRRRSRG